MFLVGPLYFSRCAGVCSYEGRGGLCSIRLSEPLLKLRPRKDLVEVSWILGVHIKYNGYSFSSLF